ncbi:hypothetical protein AB6A40_002952 [Gnathostoma spinigerum]|uniref:Reticulon-like protein n=1 Tax=Gnathostoma spinigerum TaxID=75299 RepID=A0ABD6EH15_9BILA
MSEEESGYLWSGLMSCTSCLIRTLFRGALTTALIASVVFALNYVAQLGASALQEHKDLLALIYWRDPKKSGATLAAIIVALLLFASFPVVSLLSYAGLTLLLLTIGFRCFKLGQSMMQKGDSSNPFQEYLNKDLTCSKECAYKKVDQIIEKGTPLVDHARRLFLVENIQDSLKLALLLWAFTYVGSWFSGTCLLIMFVLGVFSIPKFYEVYKEPIDKNLEVVKAKVDEVTKKVHDKVPFLKEASKPASTTVTLAPSEEEHPKTN